MKKLIVIFLLLLVNGLFAQRTVVGTITDNEKKPVYNASVTVVHTERVAKTDSSGRYSLEIPRGFVMMRIEKEGYIVREVAIDSSVIDVLLTASVNLSELGFEDLMNLKIITSTRQLTDLDKSPSPITVITAAQIQKRGFKTLEEVLQTVPGFFTGHAIAQALVMNRGIIQDQNVNYLLLIDGHAQNSISLYGMDQQHIYPFLGNVKQIEIIRGPASTLWGSDALMGIINIITKNADDLDKGASKAGNVSASFDYQFRDNHPVANVQYAKKIGSKVDFMLSYIGTQSKGDALPVLSPYYSTTNSPAPQKNITYSSDANRLYPYSQEVYLKSKIYDFTILGRYSDQKGSSGFGTAQDGSFIQNRVWQQAFVETKYDKQLTAHWKLDAKVFYDKIFMGFSQNENPYTLRRDSLVQVYADENGVGSEVMANYTYNKFNLLMGLRSVYRDCQPSYVNYLNDTVRSYAGDTLRGKQNKNHSGGYDWTNAMFGEMNYQGIKNLILIGGVRLDKNNLRDETYYLLPRASIIYKLREKWTLKYMFNTGIMRPTLTYLRDDAMALSNGNPSNIYYGTTKSQKTYSNDVQIMYTTNKLRVTSTLYYTLMRDFTTYVGLPKIFYASLAPITSKGVELEFEAEPVKNFMLYGNVSYNFATFKDSTISSSLTSTTYYIHPNLTNSNFLMTDNLDVMGPPRLLWNLGVNINMPRIVNVSLHYRGWADEMVRWGNNGADGLRHIGPEHYLDVNLLRKNCLVENLDLTFYVKNIFDNTDYAIGLPHQFVKYYGRALGFSISYRFK